MIPPRSPTKVTARSIGTEGEPDRARKQNQKQIQTVMGHSSIKVTFDTYGHLFFDNEADQRAADSVEFRLLGA